MVQCAPVASCNDGCEDTLPANCLIYKGADLSTLDVTDGETLATALTKINAIIRDLILGEPLATFNYRLRCLTSVSNPVRLISIKKNGLQQLIAPVTYPNAATATAYLQTMDPLWTFTAPNLFSTAGPDEWEIQMAC